MFNTTLKTLSLLPVVFSAATASADEGQNLQGLPLGGLAETTVEEAAPQYVDMHTVLVIDTSSSVDSSEKALMFQAIHHALTSDDAMHHFGRGISRAITIVNFADTAKSSETYILNSPEEAIEFAYNIIFNPEDKAIQYSIPHVGDGTSMSTGLVMTRNIFETEYEAGVVSIQKSVVVFADDPSSGDQASVRAISNELSSKYGAVFFGVPITPHSDPEQPSSVATFFNEYVTTPRGMTYTDPYGLETPLRGGISLAASKPEHAQAVIHAAFNMTGY